MENTPNRKPNRLNDYAKYSGMAFQMLAIIVLGVLGGIKADKYLGLKTPVFTIIFTILSVFLSSSMRYDRETALTV